MSDDSNQPRSPRYVLDDSDDRQVRLAQDNRDDGPIVEGNLINLSNSGAMILIDERYSLYDFLSRGRRIKVELGLPSRGRFALFAIIVRILAKSPSVEIGVQFIEVPKSLGRIIDRAVTPISADYSHPQNFTLAQQKGSSIATERAFLGEVLGRLSALKKKFTSPKSSN